MVEKRQFEYKGCQVTCFTNQEAASLFWDVNAGILAPEGDNLFGTTWSTAEQYTRPELALERSAQLARQKIDEMQAPAEPPASAPTSAPTSVPASEQRDSEPAGTAPLSADQAGIRTGSSV